jgi:glycosyltransferase involved in cell wall biosynthesis
VTIEPASAIGEVFWSIALRILHVLSSLDLKMGGPVVALIGLAQAQAAAGMQITVVASWRNTDEIATAESLKKNGVAVELVGPCHGPLVRHPDLAATVRRCVDQCDVVHIHALWEEIQHQSAVVAKERGIPYLVRPCGMLDPWSLAQSRWKKKVYMAWRLRKNLKRAARMHFSTEIERQSVEPLGLNVPVIVEPNGVDLKQFENPPPKGTFREKHPSLDSRPYVAFLGRLHKEKGVELLIPAFAKLKNKNAMLVVAGPDSRGYRATFEQMVRDHGLEDRVIFTGMLTGIDRIAVLSDATLFSAPSYHENFGVSVIEALAAGTPVVISDHVHIHPDITKARVGGVVPLSVDALAVELDQWLADSTLRKEAAARTRPFVWQQYDWSKIASRWKNHYDRIAHAREGAG